MCCHTNQTGIRNRSVPFKKLDVPVLLGPMVVRGAVGLPLQETIKFTRVKLIY
jgi:hypothetical protein